MVRYTSTVKTVVEPKKLLNKENRQLLIILILYAVGAVISIMTKSYINKNKEEIHVSNQTHMNIILYSSIIKLISVFVRLFVARLIGGIVSSYSVFLNLITILLVTSATTLNNINESLTRILKFMGFYEVNFQFYDVLVSLQEIDFWIYIIGGINALAPLPTIINSILAFSIIITQFDIFNSNYNNQFSTIQN